MRESSIPIDFHKGRRGRYHSVLHRSDGVSVRLEGGSYNRIGGGAGRVPHDIAHLIVEDAFGLDAGLWGTLAAGGIVQNATFAGGRKRARVGARWWSPASTADALERVCVDLRELAKRWHALADDSLLRLTWPRWAREPSSGPGGGALARRGPALLIRPGRKANRIEE
jgi:hypothetical protein